MQATCKEEEPKVSVCILKDESRQPQFSLAELPQVLPRGGLTPARREYLEKQVLPFCRPQHRDAFKAMLA